MPTDPKGSEGEPTGGTRQTVGGGSEQRSLTGERAKGKKKGEGGADYLEIERDKISGLIPVAAFHTFLEIQYGDHQTKRGLPRGKNSPTPPKKIEWGKRSLGR